MENINQELQNCIKEKDFDEEEIQNAFDILKEYDENLSNLSFVDYQLISRLLDDDDKELVEALELLKPIDNNNKNLFD